MRLYRIEITERPETDWMSITGEDYLYPVTPDHFEMPYQWQDHCMETWGRMRDFFLPSESKLYRSRSSAKDKVDIVERWGGKARILEAQVGEFVPVEQANRRRKIERLRRELDQLELDERFDR